MKTLYLDMDNVLVDFPSAFSRIDTALIAQYQDNLDEVPGIFALMSPMPMAIEAVEFLHKHFDTYILSTAPWKNPTAWSDKVEWVQTYLPEVGYKRLILSHHKNLNRGDYLVDDRLKNGADKFIGKHIHFGSEEFPTWDTVIRFLCRENDITFPMHWPN